MGKVELHRAFVWTCETCGVDQFEHGIVMENPDPDDFPDEIDPSEGVWMLAPETVTCKKCGASFETVEPVEWLDD